MIVRLIRDTTGIQCKQTSEIRQTFRAKQPPAIIHKHYWGRLTFFTATRQRNVHRLSGNYTAHLEL